VRQLGLIIGLALFLLSISLGLGATAEAKAPHKKVKLAQATAAKPAVKPAEKPASVAKPVKPAPSPPSAYEVLFTFDDGPRLDTTPKVLDTLDQYNVKAVFFVNGVRFI
jgi:peptidoglycan/xylan/chitin deacetylase (PgdA/CDA1 family)